MLKNLNSLCFKKLCPKSCPTYFSTRIQLLYENLIKTNGYLDNKEQRETLKLLDSFSQNVTSGNTYNQKSMYIFGSVGCGKTMLMDLFYKSVRIDSKLRTHFHTFMKDVHQRLHIARLNGPKRELGRFSTTSLYDPIKIVADEFANRYKLLCFDEFQVTDIADAMILKRFFEVLFDNNVLLLATSNRPPEDLYKNGLQRVNFLPFIDLLKLKSHIVHLSLKKDFRTINESLEKTDGNNDLSEETYNQALDSILMSTFVSHTCVISSLSDNKLIEDIIDVSGRKLKFLAYKNVAVTSFNDLCTKPLGASDYLAMANKFDTIFISSIPVMGYDNMSFLRRFITLIDVLYDKRIRTVLQASATPRKLFDFQNTQVIDNLHKRQSIDDYNIASPLLTNREELFFVDRTISRLIEMQTDQYWLLSGPNASFRKPN